MEAENKIISLNELGLQLLETNAAHSIYYLNQALLKSRCLVNSINKNKLLAMTYNNLGCYYNTVNQPVRALEYFQKSSRLGRLKGSDAKSIAYSHLNIAGILSKQNNHEKALRHALKSIHYLKSNLDLTANNIITLITANQVVLMEYLSLDQKNDAKLCCEETLELSYKTLGKKHPKSQEISEFYERNFKVKSSLNQPRAGSVVVQRDGTPNNINKRLLKNRLISYMPNIRNKSVEIVKPVETVKNIKPYRFCFKNINISYIRSLENIAAIRIQA